MKHLSYIVAAFALLIFHLPLYAVGPCAGISNCDDNQIQGQQQGQGQGQGQDQSAYGGDSYGGNNAQGQQQGQIGINKQGQGQGQDQYQAAYGGNQGQQQGQVGINKNANFNSNKAAALAAQAQANKQATQVRIRSDASGNSVPAFAPSISSRSTTTCITTYAGSGGGGGAGSASIFSLGLSVPIRDEDCVMEQMIRVGFESNSAAAQAKAEELYLHKMNVLAEEQGHITVAQVIDTDGNVRKVMYSDNLEAFIPVEKHPKYIRAASVAYVDMLLKAGYTPNVNPINGDGFQRVSFPLGDSSHEMIMDEDLIESVLINIDDDQKLSAGANDR